MEANFRTYESYYYQNNYQIYIRGHDKKTYQLFVVPIGVSKITENVMLYLAAPVLEFHQKMSNNCFLGSLASAFHSIGDNSVVTSLVNRIEKNIDNTDR